MQDSERSCVHVETLQVRNSYSYYNTNGAEFACVCVCGVCVFACVCSLLLFLVTLFVFCLYSVIMLTDEAAA